MSRDEVDEVDYCAICSIYLPALTLFYMCDLSMRSYCPKCWQKHNCVIEHDEGCATAVYSGV